MRDIHRSTFGDGSRIRLARNSAHAVLAVFDGHDRIDARIPLTPAEMRAVAAELVSEAAAIEVQKTEVANG